MPSKTLSGGLFDFEHPSKKPRDNKYTKDFKNSLKKWNKKQKILEKKRQHEEDILRAKIRKDMKRKKVLTYVIVFIIVIVLIILVTIK